jgi:hypothetical protein
LTYSLLHPLPKHTLHRLILPPEIFFLWYIKRSDYLYSQFTLPTPLQLVHTRYIKRFVFILNKCIFLSTLYHYIQSNV